MRLSAVTGRPCGIHLEPRTNTWPHSNAWVLSKRHRSFDRTKVPSDCHGHRHSRGTRVPSDSTWRSRWMADELTADDRCGLEIVRGGGRPDMGGAGRGGARQRGTWLRPASAAPGPRCRCRGPTTGQVRTVAVARARPSRHDTAGPVWQRSTFTTRTRRTRSVLGCACMLIGSAG